MNAVEQADEQLRWTRDFLDQRIHPERLAA
jgi:hypothetical protein